jgi:hypothetical protein
MELTFGVGGISHAQATETGCPPASPELAMAGRTLERCTMSWARVSVTLPSPMVGPISLGVFGLGSEGVEAEAGAIAIGTGLQDCLDG